MTERQARTILGLPLVFGDKIQIKAVRTLEKLESLRETGEGDECGECFGTGETECFECGNVRDCPTCEGSGLDLEIKQTPVYVRQLVLC